MASNEEDELTAPQAARAALEQIGDLISKKVLGVVSVEPSEEGWLVGAEVLEEQRVPSSSDMLALYEVEVDVAGDLLSYRRLRRYTRGKADGGSAGDGGA